MHMSRKISIHAHCTAAAEPLRSEREPLLRKEFETQEMAPRTDIHPSRPKLFTTLFSSMVSAFNHRLSRAASTWLVTALLLSGFFVSTVFADVAQSTPSRGNQLSLTSASEPTFATIHASTDNLPVSGKKNLTATTVSTESCLFALLALATLRVSQQSGRLYEDGSKASRSLRISPIICILDSVLLIHLFASLLWVGKGFQEAAQCVAAFRYGEQEEHLQLPQTSLKPASDDKSPQIRLWSIVREVGSNTRLRLLLAIPVLLQFVKLCGISGIPVETAIGAAYVQSWLLNEISIWMASPSAIGGKLPETPVFTPQISYPMSVYETARKLQTTPSATRRVLGLLVQATQACSMPCLFLILLYRLSVLNAILHAVKAQVMNMGPAKYLVELTCTMFIYLWWTVPVSFIWMIAEGCNPDHRLVTLRKYIIPWSPVFWYCVSLISILGPIYTGMVITIMPISTAIYTPITLIYLCRDLGPQSLRGLCGDITYRWNLFIPKCVLWVEFISHLMLFPPVDFWPAIIGTFCIVGAGLFYLYYYIPNSVLCLRIKPEPWGRMVRSDCIFVFHTLLNVAIYFHYFYEMEGTFRYPWVEHLDWFVRSWAF
ncbi:hypothetical protein K440DRAFT_641491 [Wilcoxina mikolae CBS 423.85]|nr:hypothetical protein K440DRAFT_641491 [Wilcoxina mikolae CBS 423.85]